MRRSGVVLVGVVILAVGTLGGCVSKDVYNQVLAENHRLNRDLADVSGRYAELKAETGVYEGRLQERDVIILEQKNEIGRLSAQVTALLAELQRVPVAGGVLPDELREALEQLQAEHPELFELDGAVVRLKSDIVFASGKHDLKDEANATLARFAEIFLQKGIGFRLRIDGHTDNEPIRHSRERYDDNWDLSYERAHAVFTALAKEGITDNDMFISAFGEHSPRVPNDTPENKQRNRRVDILLMSDEMYKTMALQ